MTVPCAPPAVSPALPTEQGLRRPGGRWMSALVGALVVTLALPSAGCSAVRSLLRDQIEDPRVTILAMSVRELSLDQVSTTFRVAIENPNPFGLTLAGIEYTLDVEGSRFAQGASRREVSLLAGGVTEAELDVDFPLASASRQLKDLLAKEQVAYTLDAVFLVGTRDVHLAIPVRFEDVLVLPKAPRVQVGRIGFTEVSSAGVGVRLLCHVENPNAFAIPLDELRATLWFGGREILENRALAGLVLPPGQVTDVPIDFTLRLEQIGLSLKDLYARPELRWKLLLRLKSGATTLPYERSGATPLIPSGGPPPPPPPGAPPPGAAPPGEAPAAPPRR